MKKAMSIFTMLAIIAGIVVLTALLLGKQHVDTRLEGSGVRGTVMLGPTCPVQRIPPDPDCDDRPYQTELLITSRSGKTSRVLSDANGRFQAELPPGDYTIAPAENKMLPYAGIQEFTVLPGQITELTIQFDSGIR